MTKYIIPLKIVFYGEATVQADNKQQAEELATYNIRATLNHISANGNDKIVDWNIDMHGDAEFDDTRDIEEEEEEDEEDE